jgi:hypothetical protein
MKLCVFVTGADDVLKVFKIDYKMGEEKYRIPLFDGKNYDDWKFRMEIFLDKKDVLVNVQESLGEVIYKRKCAQVCNDFYSLLRYRRLGSLSFFFFFHKLQGGRVHNYGHIACIYSFLSPCGSPLISCSESRKLHT